MKIDHEKLLEMLGCQRVKSNRETYTCPVCNCSQASLVTSLESGSLLLTCSQCHFHGGVQSLVAAAYRTTPEHAASMLSENGELHGCILDSEHSKYYPLQREKQEKIEAVFQASTACEDQANMLRETWHADFGLLPAAIPEDCRYLSGSAEIPRRWCGKHIPHLAHGGTVFFYRKYGNLSGMVWHSNDAVGTCATYPGDIDGVFPEGEARVCNDGILVAANTPVTACQLISCYRSLVASNRHPRILHVPDPLGMIPDLRPRNKLIILWYRDEPWGLSDILKWYAVAPRKSYIVFAEDRNQPLKHLIKTLDDTSNPLKKWLVKQLKEIEDNSGLDALATLIKKSGVLPDQEEDLSHTLAALLEDLNIDYDDIESANHEQLPEPELASTIVNGEEGLKLMCGSRTYTLSGYPVEFLYQRRCGYVGGNYIIYRKKQEDADVFGKAPLNSSRPHWTLRGIDGRSIPQAVCIKHSNVLRTFVEGLEESLPVIHQDDFCTVEGSEDILLPRVRVLGDGTLDEFHDPDKNYFGPCYSMITASADKSIKSMRGLNTSQEGLCALIYAAFVYACFLPGSSGSHYMLSYRTQGNMGFYDILEALQYAAGGATDSHSSRVRTRIKFSRLKELGHLPLVMLPDTISSCTSPEARFKKLLSECNLVTGWGPEHTYINPPVTLSQSPVYNVADGLDSKKLRTCFSKVMYSLPALAYSASRWEENGVKAADKPLEAGIQALSREINVPAGKLLENVCLDTGIVPSDSDLMTVVHALLRDMLQWRSSSLKRMVSYDRRSPVLPDFFRDGDDILIGPAVTGKCLRRCRDLYGFEMSKEVFIRGLELIGASPVEKAPENYIGLNLAFWKRNILGVPELKLVHGTVASSIKLA